MSFVYKNLTSVVPIGGLATLTGNTGGAISPTAGNINVVGTGGTTVTGSGSTLTISVSGTGLSWTEVIAASANMAVNSGYIANRGTLVTLTLPVLSILNLLFFLRF